LTELRNQNGWLQGLYTDLHIDFVERCLDWLSTAQEKFKVCGWISVSEWLSRLTFHIYHDNYPGSKGDPDVSHLLAVLDYMPSVAKLGMEGVDGQGVVGCMAQVWS
jgi:hypothetical protein